MFVYALGTQDVQLVRDLLRKASPKVQSARLEEVVDHVWEEWWISLDKLIFWKKKDFREQELFDQDWGPKLPAWKFGDWSDLPQRKMGIEVPI